jgi:hypothetical protein
MILRKLSGEDALGRNCVAASDAANQHDEHIRVEQRPQPSSFKEGTSSGVTTVPMFTTGSDVRQQLGEFDNLPCRTVREALKHPLVDPGLSAVDTSGEVQLGNPQRSCAVVHLFFVAILPALCLPPAPQVGKSLEESHRVGCLPRTQHLSGHVDMNAALGDLAECQALNTAAGQLVKQRRPNVSNRVANPDPSQ